MLIKLLIHNISFIIYRDDGCGLAAPQVGVNVRLMVWNESGKKGSGQEVVLVNPKIISSSNDAKVFEEGCLSFPGLYGDVIVSFVSIIIYCFAWYKVHTLLGA